MAALSKPVLEILTQTNFITCLCTTTPDGRPSGRFIKVVPSHDHTKLFVSRRKLEGAVKHLEKNPHAMFVVCDRYDDPLKAHAYQIDCSFDEHRIFNEDDPTFRYVAEATKDELSRAEQPFLIKLIRQTEQRESKEALNKLLNLANRLETNGMKEVLSFTIHHILDCSLGTE